MTPDDEVRRLRERVAELEGLLRRIRQWDHLDGAGDGPFWKREIDTTLAPLPLSDKEGPR